jgi:hypothetical protein
MSKLLTQKKLVEMGLIGMRERHALAERLK